MVVFDYGIKTAFFLSWSAVTLTGLWSHLSMRSAATTLQVDEDQAKQARMTIKKLTIYVDTLDTVFRKYYAEKISWIGGLNPYIQSLEIGNRHGYPITSPYCPGLLQTVAHPVVMWCQPWHFWPHVSHPKKVPSGAVNINISLKFKVKFKLHCQPLDYWSQWSMVSPFFVCLFVFSAVQMWRN